MFKIPPKIKVLICVVGIPIAIYLAITSCALNNLRARKDIPVIIWNWDGGTDFSVAWLRDSTPYEFSSCDISRYNVLQDSYPLGNSDALLIANHLNLHPWEHVYVHHDYLAILVVGKQRLAEKKEELYNYIDAPGENANFIVDRIPDEDKSPEFRE